MTPRATLLGSLGVTALLYALPGMLGWHLAWPFRMIATLVHETGHGVAARLCGCAFSSLEMWANGSGIAHSQCAPDTGAGCRALISAGGLCGPAIVAALLFVIGRRARPSKIALCVAGVALLAMDLLVMRTVTGWIVATALGAGCLWAGLRAPADVARDALVFLAVQLGLSVYSDAGYLFTDLAKTSGGTLPSDVANMARSLGGPYWLWGALCGAFSAAALALGLWLFLRRRQLPIAA
jgi:hypothetical protein